jgi:hypothetical protein
MGDRHEKYEITWFDWVVHFYFFINRLGWGL